jgi:hypothetical protein
MITDAATLVLDFSKIPDLNTWDIGNYGTYKSVTLLGEWKSLTGTAIDATITFRQKKTGFASWVDVPNLTGTISTTDGTFEFTNAIFTSEEVGLYIDKNHVSGGTLTVYVRAE